MAKFYTRSFGKVEIQTLQQYQISKDKLQGGQIPKNKKKTLRQFFHFTSHSVTLRKVAGIS